MAINEDSASIETLAPLFHALRSVPADPAGERRAFAIAATPIGERPAGAPSPAFERALRQMEEVVSRPIVRQPEAPRAVAAKPAVARVYETDEEMRARFKREAADVRAFHEQHDRLMAAGECFAVSSEPEYALFGIWQVRMSDGFVQSYSEDTYCGAYERCVAFIAKHQPKSEAA